MRNQIKNKFRNNKTNHKNKCFGKAFQKTCFLICSNLFSKCFYFIICSCSFLTRFLVAICLKLQRCNKRREDSVYKHKPFLRLSLAFPFPSSFVRDGLFVARCSSPSCMKKPYVVASCCDVSWLQVARCAPHQAVHLRGPCKELTSRQVARLHRHSGNATTDDTTS